jgi:hypothetical protein
MITNNKSKVSSSIDWNIFYNNKYFEGFRWIFLFNSYFKTKILKDPFLLGTAQFLSTLDSDDPARPGRPAKTGNTLDCEPELHTHRARSAD